MKKKNELSAISGVMIIMLAGKLLSLAANQFYLSYFGADSEQLNIFSWALQIPNYIFQSLGTALASVVIPVFAALCVQGKRKEANRFGSNIVTISTIFTVVLVVIGMALSFILPSFTDFADKSYASMAIRIMMPVMLFYGLTYIYQGILQSLNNFTAPALVNLPNGIIIIMYVVFFADKFGVTGLLWSVVLGLFLQFAILIVPAHRAGFRYTPVLDFKDPGIRTAGRMMIPIILGASAYQFNMLFNNTMMTNVSPSSVSLFNFVQTLILSSVMTLVLAITSVMYPKLTEFSAKDDMNGFKSALSGTMNGMIFLLLPISVGLICLGKPLLTLVSMHGNISAENIVTETNFLFMYCLCIVFLGLKEIVDRAFYSLKTTKISAVTGVIIMVINLIIGFILSKYTPLREYGIPLGYSAATIIGTVFLIVMLRKKVGKFGGRIGETAVKSAISSAVMATAVIPAYKVLDNALGSATIINRLIVVALPTVLGIIVFFAAALIIKTPVMTDVLSKFKNRKGQA